LQTKPSLEIDPSLAVMFAIKDESILVHDLPSVQRFWARYVDELTGENRPLGQCLATGEVAPITTKFALQVKGVPGTNAQGGSLLSAYLDSCSSYGLEGALVSPLSVEADELLSQALSYLLRAEKHHIAITNIVYAFWSDSGLASGDLFGTPNSQAVKDYLSQFQQSKQNIDPDWQFYILALTGNAGRIVVRDWVEIQEPNFAAHYQKWLDSQILNSQAQNDSSQPHFLPSYGREWSDKSGNHRWGYLSIWQLARAGVRESKEILPRTVNSIVRNAIYGEPLPIAFIQNICHHNRIEGVDPFSSLSYARSLALNMYIHSLQRRNQVTPTHEIAFQYGRLLGVHALLEQEAKTNKKKGQYFQLTNTNAMKAYASAGCSPLPMSHRLGSGATHHLALFESWQFKTMQSYVERLAEINAKIADLTEKTDIPQVFDTNAQAHFDLGFWSELHRKTKEADKSDTQSNADD
jgi:CRISPR-associated protein Csd1